MTETFEITGSEAKIKQLKRELKTRLRHDKIVYKQIFPEKEKEVETKKTKR